MADDLGLIIVDDEEDEEIAELSSNLDMMQMLERDKKKSEVFSF